MQQIRRKTFPGLSGFRSLIAQEPLKVLRGTFTEIAEERMSVDFSGQFEYLNL